MSSGEEILGRPCANLYCLQMPGGIIYGCKIPPTIIQLSNGRMQPECNLTVEQAKRCQKDGNGCPNYCLPV